MAQHGHSHNGAPCNHNHQHQHQHQHQQQHGHSHNGVPCSGNHQQPSARYMFLSMGTMMSRQMFQYLNTSLRTAAGRDAMMSEIEAMSMEAKIELFENSKQEMVNMSKNPPKNMPMAKLPVMSTQSRSVVCKWFIKKMEADFSAVIKIAFTLLELGCAQPGDAIMQGLAPRAPSPDKEMDVDAEHCHASVVELLNFHNELMRLSVIQDEHFQKVNFEMVRYFLGMIIIYAQNHEEWMLQDDVSSPSSAAPQHGHSHNGQPCTNPHHQPHQHQHQHQQDHSHSHGGKPCDGHHEHQHQEEEKPVVREFVCANGCGKKADMVCSRCKSVAYCSPDCQAKDWKVHKKTCTPK